MAAVTGYKAAVTGYSPSVTSYTERDREGGWFIVLLCIDWVSSVYGIP